MCHWLKRKLDYAMFLTVALSGIAVATAVTSAGMSAVMLALAYAGNAVWHLNIPLP